MKNIIIILLLCFSIVFNVQSQVYEISAKKDISTLAIGIGLTTLGEIIVHNSNKASIEEILLLNTNDINFFDRGAAGNNSKKAKDVSDLILYSSFVVPFITYTSKKCRSNKGVIALMVLETGLINNGMTNMFKGTVNRYRPFNYNPDVELSEKLRASSNKSYISGHTSHVAAFSFLSAKIITDLHPNMSHKKLVWGTAIAIPSVIGYLRIRAGKHFPTDTISGYIVGATVGYLIPTIHLHKNENLQVSNMGLTGFNLSLNF